MGQDAECFLSELPTLPAKEEGEVLVLSYLSAHAARMRYEECLSAGYTIASYGLATATSARTPSTEETASPPPV
ncbi:MAG TPA: hypothetical protein VF278_05015 [Pirellulales bacterium]